MPELADIFSAHYNEYYNKYGASMLPGHHRAIKDIINCRTPALGGQLFACSSCGSKEYSYHSCNNRHCPKCQNDASSNWISQQKDNLLPISHFLATFTIPSQLHKIARSHQKIIYNILFKASSAALIKLTSDKRFLGANIGMIGILHTWTRTMQFHPHIHFIIPAGGISDDGHRWIHVKNKDFLVHIKPLSAIFKAKFRDGLKCSGLLDAVPSSVWQKDWVTHIQPAGSGEQVIKYIAPYVFRVAISNSRIVKLADGLVTYKYKENGSAIWKHLTIDALKFIHRFLQHVLPGGFVKVRYYGFFAHNQKPVLQAIKNIFADSGIIGINPATPAALPPAKSQIHNCRFCGGKLKFTRNISRFFRGPP